MKKFLLKGTMFLFISLLLLNSAYRSTNYWQDENDVKKFKHIPQGIQLANVGLSHGQTSLKYDITPTYRCANFGLAMQRHDMSYLILKEYINHFAENAVLIIPISYSEITASADSNFDYLEATYYRILNPELIPNYSILKKIKFDLLPILSAGKNIIKVFDDSTPVSVTEKAQEKQTNEKVLKQDCELKYSSWTSPLTNTGKEGFAYNQQALAKIIDFCHEHNIKPVLITTPITDVLNEYFDNHEGFFDTFYRFIDEVQAKYPDILYFDYSHDERFSPDHTLFIDSDHLNLWGAKKFTPIVVSDLENAGLLQKPQSSATNTDFDD